MDTKKARDIYENFAASVAYICVEDKNKDEHIGSCFHVGEGVFVTARHVVEGMTVKSIGTTVPYNEYEDSDVKGVRISKTTYHPSESSSFDDPLYHPNPDVDVAIIKVHDLEAPAVPLGSHLDDWLGYEFVLTESIIMGYPPVPFSKDPTLISSKAEINAVIDKYTGGHPQFIVSAMSRAGFSGGPAISEFGFALGIVTESLGKNGEPTELGYLSIINIEPILVCLGHHKMMPTAIREQWVHDNGFCIFDAPYELVTDKKI
jgi:S1-C subfamily serine protease